MRNLSRCLGPGYPSFLLGRRIKWGQSGSVHVSVPSTRAERRLRPRNLYPDGKTLIIPPCGCSADDGVWESGLLQPGASLGFTFDTLGTYSYFCPVHP
jgi:plastocyanin